MSIRFFYSDAIEVLRDSFLDKLEEAISSAADPFYRPLVFIPNKHVRKWLQMESARRFGISVNIDFHFFEEGLLYLLKAINPDNTFYTRYDFLGTKDKYIDLQLLILAVILDTSYDEDLTPIYEYLFLKKGKDGKMYPTVSAKEFTRRSWHLSEKLALYFREYEYSRQEMIKCWREGKLLCSPGFKRIEKCQMKLYSKLFIDKEDKIKVLEKKMNKEYTTLPQFSRMIFSSLKTYFDFRDSVTVFIFGISHMSPFHYRLLFDLSTYYGMNIFNLNFLQNGNKDEFMLTLSALIKENRRVLEAESGPGGGDFKTVSLENSTYGSHTLLQLLQSKLRNRHKELFKPQDTSLQICGCPGIRREVETVYNSILYNLTCDPELKMTDIAVLVTDMKGYLHHIRSVFNRQSRLLPYNLGDSTAETDSIFGKALLSGLSIAAGDITRKEVFSFITNPCFAAKFSLSTEEIHTFLTWVDQLHIYRNYNEKDKYESKEKKANLNYTWSGGLKRLRLGHIMTGSSFSSSSLSSPAGSPDSSTEKNQGRAFFPRYKTGKSGSLLPYGDASTKDPALVGHFVHIMEKLFSFINDIRQLEKSGRRTGKTWSEKIRYFITEFLAIPPEYSGENTIYFSLLKDISKLELFDGIKKNSLNLTYIMEFISSNLASVPSQSGRYLSDGVTISELSRMRPIPFKIIYILGLNEGDFPGTDDMTTIDLRNITGKAGDFSRVKTNSYLFLEALMSARQKLYLTYRNKNLQKDEELYPSTLIHSLKTYINAFILEGEKKVKNGDNSTDIKDDTKEEFALIDIPLKGESIEYYKKSTLAGYIKEGRSIQDVLVNYSAVDIKLALLYLRQRKKVSSGLPCSKEKLTGQVFFDSIRQEKGQQEETIDLGLYDLGHFLESPLDALLKKHLNLTETTGEDRSLVEDEPFWSGPLYYYSIVTSTIRHYISEFARTGSAGDTDEYLESYYRFSQFKGETPEGVFARFDKKSIKQRIEKRLDKKAGKEKSLQHLIEQLVKEKECLFYENIYINDRVESKPDFQAVYAPPVIRIPPVSITLRGKAGLVFENSSEVHIMVPLAGGNRGFSKHLIRPFLFYILLKNLEDPRYRDKDLFLYKLYGTKDFANTYEQYSFSITAEQAREYLSELLTPFIVSPIYEQLPLEPVLKTLEKLDEYEQNREGYRKILQEEVEKAAANPFGFSNPLNLTALIRPPLCKTAFETVKKRYAYFTPFFKKKK